jgi:3-oxoacyl-[acyl-carrier-protein] synthase II
MGLSLGEGAGVVVLQSIDRAWATGRTGVQIAGYGGACDSHDLTAPDPLGGGLIAACRRAIARAGTSVDAIGCYHAHGTATQHNDAMENAAVRTLFAGRPVLVTGIKGSIGHTLGAAGILDAIACSAYLARGVLPPVTNLVEVDPTMSLQPVMGRPVEWAITATAGFGGINTALVLRAPGTIA